MISRYIYNYIDIVVFKSESSRFWGSSPMFPMFQGRHVLSKILPIRVSVPSAPSPSARAKRPRMEASLPARSLQRYLAGG